LLAFDRSPSLTEVLDLSHLSTAIETPAEKIITPARIVFHAQQGDAKIGPLSGAAALALGRKMDLNRTSVRDLALLPGIGPAIARRIVADRNERGDYFSPQDLTRVRGVGPGIIEKIKPLVRGVRPEPG
jgi:competence ComEA-like helix-hairpin-helix protein